MQRRHFLSVMLASAFYTSNVNASGKPLRVVVPFQSGSATDTAARLIGDNLSKAMSRPVVIDNRPGAQGLIAAKEVINSDPSGDVLLFSTNTAVTGINSFHKKPFYDPLTDLSPITQVGEFPFFLVTNANLPINSTEEFIKYAKANPGKMNYASGSSSSLIAMAQLIGNSGLDLQHIPYNSEPPAVIDLVGGRVDVMFATPTTTAGFIQEGKLRALITTTKSRLDKYPNIPTMTDSGFENLPLVPWGGFFGPRGMPPALRTQLSDVITATLSDAQLIAALAEHHITVTTSNPEEFSSFLKDQLALTLKVVKENGLVRD
ncbi:Bug family tripartite tricarboxylate transporter substrate binding protein [Pollutimonas nitritireducens]|nr:tripartite tricarboxylate transporter substrate binding protein [Pollutimonas nitritireducens]